MSAYSRWLSKSTIKNIGTKAVPRLARTSELVLPPRSSLLELTMAEQEKKVFPSVAPSMKGVGLLLHESGLPKEVITESISSFHVLLDPNIIFNN